MDEAPTELGETPFEDDEILPDGALDEVPFDKDSVHEATGNEGASFERSYRRAALVVWAQALQWSMVLGGANAAVITWLRAHANDVAAAAQCQDAQCQDAQCQDAQCQDAQCQDAQWPKVANGLITRLAARRWRYARSADEIAVRAALLELLEERHDDALIDAFLLGVVGSGAVSEAEIPALAAALGGRPVALSKEVLSKLVATVQPTSFAEFGALLLAVAQLRPAPELNAAVVAAARFIAELPATEHWGGPDAGQLVAGIVGIVAATIELRCDDEGVAFVAAACAREDAIDIDRVLAVAAGKLAATVDADRVNAACTKLWEHVLQHVERRAARRLAPPPDAARDATSITCSCADCAEMVRFLVDTARDQWLFSAAQARRWHVHDNAAGCDVTMVHVSIGKPHKLRCTKTTRAYDRLVEQRRGDRRLIAAISPFVRTV